MQAGDGQRSGKKDWDNGEASVAPLLHSILVELCRCCAHVTSAKDLDCRGARVWWRLLYKATPRLVARVYLGQATYLCGKTEYEEQKFLMLPTFLQ